MKHADMIEIALLVRPHVDPAESLSLDQLSRLIKTHTGRNVSPLWGTCRTIMDLVCSM